MKVSLRLINDWADMLTEDKVVKKYQHLDHSFNLKFDINRASLASSLIDISAHQFLPFIRRVAISIKLKKDNDKINHIEKNRPLAYAAHFDTAIYSYWGSLISMHYEEYISKIGISDSVTAYRPSSGRNNIDYANDVFNEINSRMECAVIAIDIASFFDKLSHEYLKDRLCDVLGVGELSPGDYKIFKSLTRYRYITYDEFVEYRKNKSRSNVYIDLKNKVRTNSNGVGIPQGSPVSGLLANIYLMNFDIAIQKQFPGAYYRRYSDDVIMACDRGQVDEVYKFIQDEIRKSHVRISERKTQIAIIEHIDNESVVTKSYGHGMSPSKKLFIDYLGFEYYKTNNITFRKNTLYKFSKRKHAIVGLAETPALTDGQRRKRKASLRAPVRKVSIMHIGSYHKRSAEVFCQSDMNQQILRVHKSANAYRKEKNKGSK